MSKRSSSSPQGLPAPQAREQPEGLPANEAELFRWGIENSTDGGAVRSDKLMSHKEFREMWDELSPDVVGQLKSNFAVLRAPASPDALYLALDRLLFLVEDIDTADWFIDLDGYAIVHPMLDDPDPEVRKAAAWIIANTLQNNPKCQYKFFEQVGLLGVLDSLDAEREADPAKRKFTLICNALRGCKMLREQFYDADGIARGASARSSPSSASGSAGSSARSSETATRRTSPSSASQALPRSSRRMRTRSATTTRSPWL